MQPPFFFFAEGTFFFGTDHMHAHDRRAIAQECLYLFSGNAKSHSGNARRNLNSFCGNDIFFSFHERSLFLT
jgi:hypothetical protein